MRTDQDSVHPVLYSDKKMFEVEAVSGTKTPYAWQALVLLGIILVGIGIYFVVMRPPLLPEDQRYIGTTLPQIRAAVPGLENWLQKVFWVMGGYVSATGVLLVYLAATGFRRREGGAFGAALVAGAISVGLMAVVNFIIASDFRWVLLGLACLWLLSLVLHGMKR
jgi:hypothetical protein